MFKSIESINDDIEKIYSQIKELNLIINKKEDDIKNIISEKDEIITKMKNKINEQENIIKENKKEISNLNQKIEKIFDNMTNELKNKEDKLIEMENKLTNINKEKVEEMNELKSQMNKQRLDILNKVCNKFLKLNNNELKNNYRIIVFGETGVGKSQFCNFVIRDKTNSVYRVSDLCEARNISCSFDKIKFTRLGANFELRDTAGFDDKYNRNYFQIYSKYLELKNIDYIILILNYDSCRITHDFSKFIENLIKIFTAEKLYNHFCIVFTHYYSIYKRKDKKIEVFNRIFKELFHDTNKNFENKFFFVDTEIDEEGNAFNEQSQEIIDNMLGQIKIDIDFLGSIN